MSAEKEGLEAAKYRPPRLSTPKNFDFNNPGQWSRWSSRWRRYRDASGLKNLPQSDQINTLIYTIGEQAEEVMLSRNVAEYSHDNVLKVFDEYFQSKFSRKRNVIAERAKFNRMVQGEDSMDTFVNKLCRQAEYCNYHYKALNEELIRDRLVVGVKEDELSEQLQAIPDLTLDQATTAARRYEASKQAQAVVGEADSNSNPVDSVKAITRYRNDKKLSLTKSVSESDKKWGEACDKCGRRRHTRGKCPASNAECRKCGQRGHFGVVCRSQTMQKAVGEVNEQVSALEVSEATSTARTAKVTTTVIDSYCNP